MENLHDPHAYLRYLLASVSNGDERAFRELHRRTHAYLYSVAYRVLHSESEAEEVLQESYLSVWKQARRFRPELGSPMTWLITIVRNNAIAVVRHERRRKLSTVSIEEVTAGEEEAVDREEFHDPIRQAFLHNLRLRFPALLSHLEAGQRQSITLALEKGLTHAEISEHLKVPLGTAKSWLRRGLLEINSRLASQHASRQRCDAA